MIKTIIRAMYSSFLSIVLISIILAAWTSYAFFTQSSKSSEIINVIHDMYTNQKSVVVDVVNLSKILLKDTGESLTSKNNEILAEEEFMTDLDNFSQSEELSITEDNPLGIVIEPSLPELSENTLPEIIDESLVNKQNENSMNQIDIEMDMNS
tara:strand:+ start:1369 stop:1827 length:459 start_codon:yes stop_codon:yes gene_type:complete